jgi:hypothetical protein
MADLVNDYPNAPLVDRLRSLGIRSCDQAADEIELLRCLARFLLDDDANGAMAMMLEHDSLRALSE